MIGTQSSVDLLPPRSPNLNSYSERWVLSVKSDGISGLIFFGEPNLLKALKEYMIHNHQERNHQGKENRLLFPSQDWKTLNRNGKIKYRSRLGGRLKYYYIEAA